METRFPRSCHNGKLLWLSLTEKLAEDVIAG